MIKSYGRRAAIPPQVSAVKPGLIFANYGGESSSDGLSALSLVFCLIFRSIAAAIFFRRCSGSSGLLDVDGLLLPSRWGLPLKASFWGWLDDKVWILSPRP